MAAKLIDNYTIPTAVISGNISFTTASASFVAVTGATVTLVNQRGRPVFIALIPNTTSAIIGTGGAATADMELEFLRGATVISISKQLIVSGAGGVITNDLPPSSYWVLDNPGIGSFVYTVQIRRVTAGNTAAITNCILSAYEL